MMLQWIAAAMLFGGLLAVAGTCLAHFAPRFGLPRRWLWLAMMALSLGLPVALALQSHPAPAPQPIPAVQTAQRSLSPEQGSAPSPSGNSDLLVLLGWAAASLALTGMFALSHRRTLVQMHGWERRDLLGSAVTVSPDFGPAAVGLIHPDVVVPEWIFELPRAEQRLVLLHEQQHIQAGDHFVLLAGVVTAVLMPWNLGLWWQLRRLRVGMELDCDARVAPTSRERPRYAELLLKARSDRATGRMALALVPAPSALAERLLELLDRAKPSRRQMAAWSASAVACVVVVSRVPVPDMRALVHRAVPAAGTSDSFRPPVATVLQATPPSSPAPKPVAKAATASPWSEHTALRYQAKAVADSTQQGHAAADTRKRYDRLIPYVPDTNHSQGGRGGGIGVLTTGAVAARRTATDTGADVSGAVPTAKFGPGYGSRGTPGGGRAGRIGMAAPLDSVSAKKPPALPDSLLGPRP